MILVPAAMPARAEEAVRAAVPFAIHAERSAIIVDAVIAGRPVRMVVDTGSKLTIVHHAVVGVDALELARARMNGPGTRGRAVAIAAHVELGPLSGRRTLAAMDLTDVQALFRERVDGVIGMDILLDCVTVTLDFRAQTLECGGAPAPSVARSRDGARPGRSAAPPP